MSRLCERSALPSEGACAFQVDGRDIIVISTAEGPRAFLNVCPHQGRSLDFAPGEFLFSSSGQLICPHHGACFDPASGECIDGPCKGDRLTPLNVTERDGALWLDA